MNYPFVTLLVAARNEEENIRDLLVSIDALTYPKDRLQVLIGNDASADATAEVIQSFIQDKPWFEYFLISDNREEAGYSGMEKLKGKARVLAMLSHHAKGEFFFYTDADVELPSGWIERMLHSFGPSETAGGKPVGVVVGITIVKPESVFAACQALEWLLAIYLMKLFCDLKIATTGMGNNMAVRSDAYRSVGGYEKIGFSIVEDFALYKAVIDDGYPFVQAFEPGVIAVTKPPRKYFEQRKRWFRGGMESGSFLIVPIMIQALALPFLFVVSFFSVWLAAGIFIGVFVINMISGVNVLKRLKQERLIPYLPVYTVYMFVFWFLQLLNYLLPTRLVWKGRAY